MTDDFVRYNVRMPEKLRDDAKRSAERGELSEEVRSLFHRIAYGSVHGTGTSELEKARAELESVRNHKDDLRRERRRIDAEIESVESRETRLEEQVERLEATTDELEETINALERMLLNGERMFPKRIENAVDDLDVDADRVRRELQDRNPEVPDYAFELSSPSRPNNWKNVE